MAFSPERDDLTPDLELIGPIKREYPTNKTVIDGPTPTAAEGKSEEIYEVQQVLEHLLSPDGLYLKVRWEGYGEDQDSWEPEVDLKECAGEIVKEYLASLSEKDKKSITKLRKELAAGERKKKAPTPKPKGTKKKETKPKIKREVESDSEEKTAPNYVDSSDSESDTSSKKKNKGRRRSKAADDGFEPKQKRTKKEEKSTVTTKAALKQYPSSAKQAAIKHRQTWLNDSDSSDNEHDEMNENSTSFDDEIKAKLQTKKRERAEKKTHNHVSQKNGDDESGSESPDPEDSDLLQTPPTLLFKNIDKKSNGPAAMVFQIANSIGEQMGEQGRNGVDSDWLVEGITQHKDSEAKTIIVLLSNSKNGEKRTVSAIDAYELAGWNLCKWLLNRCSF